MMEELHRHGYDIGAGTPYPILHQLEEVGYLASQAEVVGGKRRKYYRATPEKPPPWRRPRRSCGSWSRKCSTTARPATNRSRLDRVVVRSLEPLQDEENCHAT